MITPEEKEVLYQIGMTDAWIDLGLATPTIIEAAQRALESNEPIEHVRYAAIKDFLNSQDVITDEQFRRLVSLLQTDADQTMASAAMVDLARHENLNDANLAELLAIAPEVISNSVRATQLRRQIERDGITNSVLDEIIASNQSWLQRWIVESPDLTISMLDKLASLGANKAIRNVAAEHLRTRRG